MAKIVENDSGMAESLKVKMTDVASAIEEMCLTMQELEFSNK